MDRYDRHDSPLGPPQDELVRILERCGCSIRWGGRLHDGSPAYRVQCPDHAAKLRLLRELATWDSRHPDVLRLAERSYQIAGHDETTAAAVIHRLVRDTVSHRREPTERFQATLRTLKIGVGDCDDTARAVYALARAAGFDAELITLGDPPRHVSAVIRLGGRWRWADASLPAELGEHPLAAARRLARAGTDHPIDRGPLADLAAAADADGDERHPQLAVLMAVGAVGLASYSVAQDLASDAPVNVKRAAMGGVVGMLAPLTTVWTVSLIRRDL